MSKEEAHIQHLLKELRALPDNKICAVCVEKFPQYVCTNFGTFVCSSCSGIHREFGHRIKGISLSTFSLEEVSNLQKTGNAGAKATYFARWNPNEFPKPDTQNKDAVRKFIRMAFIDQVWKEQSAVNQPAARDDPVSKPKKRDYMAQIPPPSKAGPAQQTQFSSQPGIVSPISVGGSGKPSVDDLLISWDDGAQQPQKPAQPQPQYQMPAPLPAPIQTPQTMPAESAPNLGYSSFFEVSPQKPPQQATQQSQPFALPSTISIPQQAPQQPQHQPFALPSTISLPQQVVQQQQQPLPIASQPMPYQYGVAQPQQPMAQFVPQGLPPGAVLFNPFAGQPVALPQQYPQQTQQIPMQMSPQPQPAFRPQPTVVQPQMMFNPFGPQVMPGQPVSMQPVVTMQPGQLPSTFALSPVTGAPIIPGQGRPGNTVPQPVFVPSSAPGQPMMMMRPGPVTQQPNQQGYDADYLLALRLQEEENRAAQGGRPGPTTMSEDEKLARRLQEEENARWD